MHKVFGTRYAALYDAMYRDKDYAAECRLVQQLLDRHPPFRVRHVLDLGCGTGGHSLRLAQQGYTVVGVDRSAAMLQQARAKTAALRLKPRVRFYRQEIQRLRVPDRFDAALMMFAVLGYQTRDADVHRALEAIRRHLRPKGLLLFDVWYAPAVAHLKPGTRSKLIPAPKGGVLRRTATGQWDPVRRICDVTIRLGTIAERHRMRAFGRMELRAFLRQAGFRLLQLSAFPEMERAPSRSTWNVLGLAQAV